VTSKWAISPEFLAASRESSHTAEASAGSLALLDPRRIVLWSLGVVTYLTALYVLVRLFLELID
jgi:hypothetical protein